MEVAVNFFVIGINVANGRLCTFLYVFSTKKEISRSLVNYRSIAGI